MKQQAAVLGVGQTRHRSRRADVSIAGLCREAADWQWSAAYRI